MFLTIDACVNQFLHLNFFKNKINIRNFFLYLQHKNIKKENQIFADIVNSLKWLYIYIQNF